MTRFMDLAGLKGVTKLVIFLLMSGLLLNTAVYGAAETKPMIRCIEKERLALLEFRKGLIDDRGMLSSWGSDKECCEWNGILCSNTTNHVIAIKLQGTYNTSDWRMSTHLSGKISPSLLGLKHLNHLDLSGNEFFGEGIPKFIGLFPPLKFLNLSLAGFSGKIPPQLGNLTNLQVLDLSGNWGLEVENIGWLSGLSYLKYLNLAYADLSMNPNWLQEIFNLHSLQELYLKGCKLPQTRIALPFSMVANASLPFLSTLDLSSSFIIELWPFNATVNLISIDLSSNNIRGPISAAIGELQHLEHLILGENDIENGSLEFVANLSRLKSLDLTYNQLREPLYQFLHLLRGSERSLETLQLGFNELNGAIPDLSTFSSLTALILTNNYLDGLFPRSIELPPKLVHLDLSHNAISGHLPDMTVFLFLKEFRINNNAVHGFIPQSIGRLGQLQNLDLSFNLLQGVISEVHFSTLSNLKELDLSFNSIALNFSSHWNPPFQAEVIHLDHCSLGPSFPSWLQTQHNISRLGLSSVGISGPFPDWFWKTCPQSLIYLDISENNISDNLPSSLASIFPHLIIMDASSSNMFGAIPSLPPNLEVLDLSNNSFIGSIFPLCGLTTIEVLYLSDNALSGGIPECLFEIRTVEYLDVANNNLSGKVPNSIGSGSSIRFLCLRNNNLKGEVPSSLKNCTRLTIMDLGKNMLTGYIPAWMGQFSSLVILSLQFNHFYGKIPSSLCQLSNIQVLDLSRNNISGTIPQCFSNLLSLAKVDGGVPFTYGLSFGSILVYDWKPYKVVFQWKTQEHEFTRNVIEQRTVDLSSNQLVGKIPPAIASLKALRSLNLSRNHLTGNIVMGFGQVEMLESLDLSHNELSGEIPSDFTNLTKLGVLDLSYNNLSGKIPSSTQLQTFDASSYAGNAFLCGLPLSKCPGDDDANSHPSKKRDNHGSIIEEDASLLSLGFYVSTMLGFLVGFWGVVGPLFFNRKWRTAYFSQLSDSANWIYVTTMMLTARIRQIFFGLWQYTS